MYVCICRAVTESEVLGCIAAGACTVEDVGLRCEAGTGCGSCVTTITAMLGGSDTDDGSDPLRRIA